MTRKEELYKLIGELDENTQLLGFALVDRLIYLEEQLLKLEQLPFIKVHPDDPMKQKELPARKMYIPLLQQYNLILKTILKLFGNDVEENESTTEFKKYLEMLNHKLYGGNE